MSLDAPLPQPPPENQPQQKRNADQQRRRPPEQQRPSFELGQSYQLSRQSANKAQQYFTKIDGSTGAYQNTAEVAQKFMASNPNFQSYQKSRGSFAPPNQVPLGTAGDGFAGMPGDQVMSFPAGGPRVAPRRTPPPGGVPTSPNAPFTPLPGEQVFLGPNGLSVPANNKTRIDAAMQDPAFRKAFMEEAQIYRKQVGPNGQPARYRDVTPGRTPDILRPAEAAPRRIGDIAASGTNLLRTSTLGSGWNVSHDATTNIITAARAGQTISAQLQWRNNVAFLNRAGFPEVRANSPQEVRTRFLQWMQSGEKEAKNKAAGAR